jgi:hypothetical protein
MNIYLEKYGFVYIWRDRKHKRYYIGSHWGTIDDGYICSSGWMSKAYKIRPEDFKRRIISYVYSNRVDLLNEEKYWLDMIKDEELATKNTTVETRKKIRYYNFTKVMKNPWHSTPDGISKIGDKISKLKTGKSVPCSPEKAKAISKAKKKKFEEKKKLFGYKVTPETLEKMSQNRKGKTHTEEWKKQNSERMKQQWSDGNRKRAQPKSKMTREEQDRDSAIRLKSKWADPIWKENQKQRLKEGAKTRPPRSEESKRKAREAQLGKPKIRKNINRL